MDPTARQNLIDEEKARYDARKEIEQTEALAQQNKPWYKRARSSFWRFLNGGFVLWFLSSVVVSMIAYFYRIHVEEGVQRQLARQVADTKANLVERELMYRISL